MLLFYKATYSDCDLLFRWANDPIVRSNSFNQNVILYEDHKNWLKKFLNSERSSIYIFTQQEIPAGQVRINKNSQETIIGISIDSVYRGKSLAVDMLTIAANDYFLKFPEEHIFAYIKQANIASLKVFKKAGFKHVIDVIEQGVPSYKMEKSLE